MPAVYRCFIDWTGQITGAASSTLHFLAQTNAGTDLEAADCAQACDAFIAAVGGLVGGGVNLQTRSVVDVVDVPTGALTAQFSVAVAAPRAGGGEGPYSRPSGAAVTWGANKIINGRRLRGRTFLVPLGGNAYDNGGRLSTVGLNNLNNAALALINDPDTIFVILHRAIAGVGGDYGEVVTGRFGPDPAILRSRRD